MIGEEWATCANCGHFADMHHHDEETGNYVCVQCGCVFDLEQPCE